MKRFAPLFTILFLMFLLGCKKDPQDVITPYTPTTPTAVDPRPVVGDFSVTITNKSSDIGLIRRIPSLKVDIIAAGTKNEKGFLTSITSFVMYNPNTLDWAAAKIEDGYPTIISLSTGYYAELKDYNKNSKTVKIKLSLKGKVVKDYYTQQLPNEFFQKVEQYTKLKNGRIAAKSDCETLKDAAKWAGAVGDALGCGMGIAFPVAGIANGLGTVASCLGAVDSAWELLSPDHKPLSDKLGPEAGEMFRNAVEVGGFLGGGKYLGESHEAVNALNNIVDKFGQATTGAGYFPCENPFAHSTGDPHLTTLDGLRYDFQGHGEFIALKSATDNFEVQVRQERVNNSETVTMNTAVAVQTGTDVVCVAVKPDRLFINNQPQSLAAFTRQSLKDGASVSKMKDGIYEVLSIYHKNGDLVRVRFHDSYLLDYSLYLTDSRKGKVYGLVGDYDGNKDNDVQVRNGSILSGQTSLKFSDMYPAFADSWRITQPNSLFYYDAGKNTDTYTKKDFPKGPVELTADQKAKAEAICRAAGVTSEPFLSGCIMDVALTGDASLASSSLWGQTFDTRPAGIPLPTVAEAISVKRITYLNTSTFLLKSDGTLWAAGWSNKGMFGIGKNYHEVESSGGFIQIMSGIKDIATGHDAAHMLFLKNDNTVWAAGYNSEGQIGNGATDRNNVLTAVKIMNDGKALAVGDYNSFVIKTDNSLWAVGQNDGRLGDGAKVSRFSPVRIMDDVKAVAAGTFTTLVLKTDNTLWGMGSKLWGTFGLPQSTSDFLTPNKLMDKVQAIASGNEHSLILKTDNTLWVSGSNSRGQLGLGTEGDVVYQFSRAADNVQGIAAGNYHSLILKTDNTLWATGYNRAGQFGNGNQINRSTFGQIMSGVRYVVTGGGNEASTFVIKTDNTLWAAGDNIAGQLGFASPPNQASTFVPIVVK